MVRTSAQLKAQVSRGRFVIRTMSEGYSLDNGETIAASVARNELQLDLFCEALNTRAKAGLVPQDDGLFPGFSQTWRAE